MLEPLFRCNLACVGCGKIDYPDAILNRRMSAQECWDAPMNAAPRWWRSRGEPLIHKEIGEIVRGLVARKKFVSLCTNALLLEKKLDLFEPSPYLFFSVHLDGLKDHHDKAVSQKGVFDRAVSAIRRPRPALHRQTSTPPSSTATRPRRSPNSRLHHRARRRRVDVAGLCL